MYACQFKQKLLTLSSKGKIVDKDNDYSCLDVVAGPGGALYGTDMRASDKIWVRKPVGTLGAHDVMPYRGRANMDFILSGEGFTKQGKLLGRLLGCLGTFLASCSCRF